MTLLISILAQAADDHKNANWDVDKKLSETKNITDHHAFVHPFLSHMGMPEGVGEISTRVMSVEDRNAGVAEGTYGFHIESGIFDRLGIHLRNDGVKKHKKTEMMLQYVVLNANDGLSGISLFAEIEFPTGSTSSNRVEGLYGVSFTYLWKSVLITNSSIHYNPDEKEVEWEIAFVGRLTDKIFPVLEFSGKNTQDMSRASGLLAWKFKIPENNSIGVAYQVPVTTPREFDSQLMLQAEFNFH